MNREQIELWKEGVFEHTQSLDTVITNRKLLVKHMAEHLSQFFDWDDIEFSRDFNTITMMWKYSTDPIIKTEVIKELGMDFIISHKFHKDYGDGVTITVYPFGLPEEGVITES